MLKLYLFMSFNLLLVVGISINNKTDIQPRVHGGKEIDGMKYFVRLENKSCSRNNSCRNICSGSIIRDRWILTAAHCYYNNTLDNIMHYTEKAWHKIGEVSKVFSYPGYEKIRDQDPEDYDQRWTLDIAVVKTLKSIVFTQYLGLISLPTSPIGQAKSAKIVGNGLDDEGKYGILRQGTVRIIKCPHSTKYYGKMVICSEGMVGSGGGDSGGPLVLDNRVVGVTITGSLGGPTYFSQYVDVYAKLDWIKSTIKNVK